MKQIPTIHSVQCRVRYEETELKRLIHKQAGSGWFWKRNTNSSRRNVDGYATLSTFTAPISLGGVIEIAISGKENFIILQVPSFTRFLMTCIEQNENDSIPAFAVSLS